MAIVTATVTPKVEAKNSKTAIEFLRKKHAQPVRGRFCFHELKGGRLCFNFKEFKGDKNIKYELVDGEIYTLPYGVVKHLNKDLWYPVHEYQKDEYGNNIQKVGKKIRRASFESLQFVEDDDLMPETSNVLTVENVIG